MLPEASTLHWLKHKYIFPNRNHSLDNNVPNTYNTALITLYLSFHPFSTTYPVRGHGGAGAFLNIWGRRWGHPGQIVSSSQGWHIETNKLCKIIISSHIKAPFKSTLKAPLFSCQFNLVIFTTALFVSFIKFGANHYCNRKACLIWI